MSEHHDVSKTVRLYWTIGAALYAATVITVAVNRVHLAIPFAITVALIIAIVKGSMVASVFMHLSNERKWVYGALLLTIAFFVVLLSIPLLTMMDTIGTPTVHEVSTGAAHPGAIEHEGR